MKTQRQLFFSLIIIGVINLIVGGYSWNTGAKFQDYFFLIFIGLTLLVSAYISLKQTTKTKN